MIRLQEATTHNEKVTVKATEQFHFHYGADQLILFHKNLFFESEAQSSKANFVLNLMLRALPRTFRTAWC